MIANNVCIIAQKTMTLCRKTQLIFKTLIKHVIKSQIISQRVYHRFMINVYISLEIIRVEVIFFEKITNSVKYKFRSQKINHNLTE